MYNTKRDDVLVCMVKLKSENKVKDRKIMWKKKKGKCNSHETGNVLDY